MAGDRKTKKKSEASAPASTQSFFGQPVLILIVVIAMAVGAFYLLLKGPAKDQKPARMMQDSSEKMAAEETMTMDESDKVTEASDVVAAIQRHILVNETEQPFVATITNIDLVKQRNPDFYRDAQAGDKVVIWTDRAVIYSPSKDRIVGAITAFSDFEGQTAGPIEDVTIEVRNGTRIPGEAGRVQNQLEDEGMVVSGVGDASAVYEGTVVIDLTDGTAPNAMAKTLEIVGGEPGVLPDGEAESGADILVILGL